jgi:DNA-binding beta-propeller fold protein YncE
MILRAGLLIPVLIPPLAGATPARADPPYETRVIARGLMRPTGIVAGRRGDLYITQLPTPGVGGGSNTVSRVVIRTGEIETLTMGEPEPTNLAVSRAGDLYWTCKSAGVILTIPGGESDASLFLGGLDQPSGIAIDENGADRGTVYFTQIPMPEVAGGLNGVFAADEDGDITTLSLGEPEPTDVALARRGDLYWTCKSAGVILKRSRAGDISLLLSGLNKPQGIAIDPSNRFLYFTEVPTPGVPGSLGGLNKVWRYDLRDRGLELVDAGDPEPADITVSPIRKVYWTCASAGVIVEARRIGP